MSIIVGLGNAGQEYDGTRHNIGFEVVDLIAETLSVSFRAGGGPFVVAEGRHKGRKIVLVKPTNFMSALAYICSLVTFQLVNAL